MNRNWRVLFAVLGLALLGAVVLFTRANRSPVAPEGMVYVPGGTYTVGSGASFEAPRQTVTLAPFFIDRFPVSLGQYLEFLHATDYGKDDAATDARRRTALRQEHYSLPVTEVSFADAQAYAQWKNQALPTEEQWEAAARGPRAAVYPWGDGWSNARVNIARKAVPFGQHPEGASPCGAEDMVGNIFHLTSTSCAPQVTSHERSAMSRLVKGGAWAHLPSWNRCSFRSCFNEKLTSPFIGFRLVAPAPGNAPPPPQATPYHRLALNEYESTEAMRQTFSYELRPDRTLPDFVVERVNAVKEGESVADIGSGIGFLSFLLARQVGPKGQVYCVDIDKSVIDFVTRVASVDGLTQLRPLVGTTDNITLPPGSCDRLFLLGTLRCLNDRIADPFLESCRKALKADGVIVAIDDPDRFPFVKATLAKLRQLGFQVEVYRFSDYGKPSDGAQLDMFIARRR